MGQESQISRLRETSRREGGAAYQARRAEVVRAAALVFKERGYQGTTLAHVAEALGTDRASLYYYVGGKQELFEEIVAEAILANLRRAIAIRDGPGSGAERIHALVGSLMESFDEFYPVLYVLLQENFARSEVGRTEWPREVRDVVRDWEQVVVGLVRAGQQDGSIRDDAPAWLIASGVIGMFGWSHRWYRRDGELSAAQIGERLGAIVLQGLAPGPAGPLGGRARDGHRMSPPAADG